MDEELKELVTALVNNALTTQLVIAAFLFVIGAGLGAYFGAYLSRKAQRRADQEDFRRILEEDIQRTLETEKIKSAIASAADASSQRLRTDLEGSMAFVTFQRELIARNHEKLVTALQEFATIAENMKYEWPRGEIDQARPKVIGYFRMLELSSAMLQSLGVVEISIEKQLHESIKETKDHWESALAIKVQYSQNFREAHPDIAPPSTETLIDTYGRLELATDKLTASVIKFVRSTLISGLRG